MMAIRPLTLMGGRRATHLLASWNSNLISRLSFELVPVWIPLLCCFCTSIVEAHAWLAKRSSAIPDVPKNVMLPLCSSAYRNGFSHRVDIARTLGFSPRGSSGKPRSSKWSVGASQLEYEPHIIPLLYHARKLMGGQNTSGARRAQ